MKELFKTFKREDFFDKVNLHIHSNYSDGECTFEELIKQAETLGLQHYSITDHNTIDGYKNLSYVPNGLITGVEFDCFYDLNLPHILGYGIDINNEAILKLAKKFQKGIFEIPKRILTSRNPKDVIDAIHKAGGIAVLAHPCCYWCLNLDRFIEKLVQYGLDGVEVYYPYDRATRVLKFHSGKTVLKIAEKYNLLKTGGQDQHKNLTGGVVDGNLY